MPETKNMTSDSVENYRNKLSQAKDTLANAQKLLITQLQQLMKLIKLSKM